MKILLFCFREKSKQSQEEIEHIELSSYVEEYSNEKQTFIKLKLGENVGVVKIEELEKAIQALK